MDETIDEGDLGHLNHHELLHERYNDSVSILSGTAAARPAANSVAIGTLYWATDTSTLSRSDGALWDDIAAGVSDHGALSGLGDDDHPQYLTEAEADALYEALGDIAAHAAAADPHTGYRLESADHSHQTTGLQGGKIDHGAALDGLVDDDHTQYHTAARHAAVDAADHGSGASADGTVLTSDGIGGAAWEAAAGGGETFVYKTADETVSSSAVLQDDDHLFFTVAANGIYLFRAFLHGPSNGQGLDLQWTEPDGTWAMTALIHNVSPSRWIESTARYLVGTGAFAISFNGVILVGGTGGTFKLQWAQQSAGAPVSTLNKGSWLTYKKLN